MTVFYLAAGLLLIAFGLLLALLLIGHCLINRREDLTLRRERDAARRQLIAAHVEIAELRAVVDAGIHDSLTEDLS